MTEGGIEDHGVGGVSGFIGGRLDLTVQRFVDAWMSIPGLLILLTVMSVVGRGVLQIIVVLGVLGGIGGSRVVRGAVIAAKENVYFEAARAVGSSRWRTLLRHLLPNIAPVLIVIYSINIGAVVISEASLSFLGFGLPTTVPSWGGMLSREGRQYMEIAPRLAVWPGLCLTVVVYCLNMVGDALRDLLDPRLRGGRNLIADKWNLSAEELRYSEGEHKLGNMTVPTVPRRLDLAHDLRSRSVFLFRSCPACSMRCTILSNLADCGSYWQPAAPPSCAVVGSTCLAAAPGHAACSHSFRLKSRTGT